LNSIDRADLQRVKAQGGRQVEIAIGMVDAVQPPEQRNAMRRPVLCPDRQIEQQDGEHPLHPAGQAGHRQQAEIGLRRIARHRAEQRDEDQRLHPTLYRHVDQHEAEMRGPAPCHRQAALAAREERLGQQQRQRRADPAPH
jgi:hypothetical protein